MNKTEVVPEPLRKWPGHTGNWHRWPNDRGTLNLVTEEVVLRGLSEARLGRAVACARSLVLRDPIRDTPTATHRMLHAGKWDRDPHRNVQSAADEISFRVHSMANTHIDAFSHIGFEGYAFNGRRFEDMVTMDGAHYCDVTDELSIVSRGIFVDVAGSRGIPHLEPGDWVRPEELEVGLAKSEPGDILIVRTGGTLGGGRAPGPDDPDAHGVWAGFHPDCIELIARNDIAVLGSDSPSDTFPSPVIDLCKSPIHVLSLVFFGMPLVHNMDLEALARASRELDRDTFTFSVTALNVPGATGSLCTPFAIF